MKNIKKQNQKFKQLKMNFSERSDTVGLDSNGEEEIEWGELTFGDKMKMFNEWSIVLIIANLFHIVGTVFLILNSSAISKNGAFLIGFGTFFIWTSIMRYF